jgi:hypothetical protein
MTMSWFVAIQGHCRHIRNGYRVCQEQNDHMLVLRACPNQAGPRQGHFCLFAGVHKHYTVEDWIAFGQANPDAVPFVAASAGSSEADAEKLAAILKALPVDFICLDVANGYSEHVSVMRMAITLRNAEETRLYVVCSL